MDRRQIASLGIVVVALSLVGAPITMADWGEQATVSVERIDESQVDEEAPILRFERLSTNAQDAVRRAIESADGHHTVYGYEDWPDRFFYSDYIAPGQGLYVVVYEGQHYRLTTYAGGGFPFVYWLFELPFVVYGVVLLWVGRFAYRETRSSYAVAVATLLGIAFHLLGPEFDFPVLAPKQFVGLGVVATIAVVTGVVRDSVRERNSPNAE